ncbi:ankyrin repeat protein [Paraburkholderia fungorum]|jgi:hypothetical protein|uniref:ankyrin repeat domain-containing protein n=1 Tax=Paraburkholderia fungorum TaxID=134537 RepID=UPI000D0834A3|nr:ankyrin repeat domain-containing protein [Paraburkholderia fungorum]PRZ56496.1 ankyrin repeat protein [Paraburkholderia fungorum]
MPKKLAQPVADLPETRPPSESPEPEHPAELIELAAPIRTPPLIEAVLARDPGAVAYLLANGEDPNELDARGNNALVAAIILRRGYGRAALLQIVDLLLPATNVKAVDPRGRTVLMAAADGDPESLARLLPLVDAKAQDADGQTALMRAAAARSAECVKRLLPVSDPDALDSSARTALDWAIANGDPVGALALAKQTTANLAAALPLAAARARSLQADLRALQARIAARVDKEPKKEERDEEARLTREMREWLALADTIGARAPIRGIVTAIRGLGDEKLPLTRARLAEVEEQSAGAMEHRNRPTALGEPPRGRATRKIVD